MLALIAAIIFISTGLNNLYLGDIFSGYFLLLLSSCCLVTWMINFFGKPILSISYLFFLISIAIFYFDSYSGAATGTYLFYFPLLMAIANIFDFQSKKDRIRMISHLAFVGILVFTNLFSGHQLFENRVMTDRQQKMMFIINMSLSFSCLSYFIFLIVNTNIQRVNLLKSLIAEENKLRIFEQDKNRDKEILLAELQHRLKNNLSLMSSLLKLKLENINDSNYSLAFKESIHAIQTIAQANHLQKFEDGRMLVPIRAYLSEVQIYWLQLLDGYPIQGKVEMNCQENDLNIKQAIPVGLIFHEVISLFWFHCLENDENHQLIFDVSQCEGGTKISISGSIPNLFWHNKTKEIIIQALIEQIDAKSFQKSRHEFVIEIANIQTPMLESESLFK